MIQVDLVGARVGMTSSALTSGTFEGFVRGADKALVDFYDRSGVPWWAWCKLVYPSRSNYNVAHPMLKRHPDWMNSKPCSLAIAHTIRCFLQHSLRELIIGFGPSLVKAFHAYILDGCTCCIGLHGRMGKDSGS